ncbi:MAG TPA: ABC transporter ATP-binding protein [Longimicrobiales bacterium]|nr:ABC transporter ATP-binding protein [Longimicrobiales bacterium]
MSRLVLRDVGKTYPGAARAALRAVDLLVEPGELVGVVGESGSGKTTLLRTIAGLESPTTGTIVIDDRVVSRPRDVVPPEQRGVGLVFQDYALFPHLTVERNIAYGLHRLKRPQRLRRVQELLELVGLAGLGGRYPHELSGGQRQRVAIARALAPDPAVLLLDEPFSNLDTALKDELRAEVGRILRESGTTALIVVHDADDVLALADRVAILRDGDLWQIGSPRELYERPRDAYVARFFGPTNIIPAIARDGVFETSLGDVVSRLAAGNGAPVMLSVRPADIEPAPGGATATVLRASYRGAFVEFTATLQDESGTGLQVVGNAPAGANLTVGQEIGLRIRQNGVQLLGGA